MVDDATFFAGIGILGGFTLFLLHRVYALRGEVSEVQTAIRFKNEKLSAISDKVERIDKAVDTININVATIQRELEINKQ